MNQTDILFASIVGSKVAESIPRFEVVQNELSKHVLPAIPFLPFKGRLWRHETAGKQFFPFSFFDEKDVEYLLPYEPILNISSKNNIVRRNVAKVSKKHKVEGTIKERLGRDDYVITITGALYGSIITGDVSECYPRRDFEKLAKFMTAPNRLKVNCEPLQLLGINYIVIEDFSFPFTKGEHVQAYEIKAYSDFTHDLLVEIED